MMGLAATRHTASISIQGTIRPIAIRGSATTAMFRASRTARLLIGPEECSEFGQARGVALASYVNPPTVNANVQTAALGNMTVSIVGVQYAAFTAGGGIAAAVAIIRGTGLIGP